MGKFELFMFAVGGLALLSGTGFFSARNRSRAKWVGNTPRASSGEPIVEASGSAAYVAPLRISSVEVTDEKGARICSGSTPTSFRLDPVGAQSFGSTDYRIQLRSPQGHQPHAILRSVPNGWYIRGEFIFGARVGWIVFEPESGALFHLEHAQLANAGVGDPDAGDCDSNVAFVLLDDVPDRLRTVLRRLSAS